MKDLSPETRRLIERASSLDEPDAEASERVERNLSRRLALGVGIVGGGATVAKSATGAGLVVLGAKSAAAALVVGAVVMTGYGFLRPEAPAQNGAAEQRPGLQSPERKRVPATSAMSSAPRGEPRSASVVAEAQPSAKGAATRERPKAPRTPPPETAPPLAVRMDPTPAPEDALVAETRALGSAQRAMRAGDPALAIRLLSEQDAQFPGGALAQERSAARVLALCQAGRISEARARAQAFQRNFPRSPLTAKVVSACAEK